MKLATIGNLRMQSEIRGCKIRRDLNKSSELAKSNKTRAKDATTFMRRKTDSKVGRLVFARRKSSLYELREGQTDRYFMKPPEHLPPEGRDVCPNPLSFSSSPS